MIVQTCAESSYSDIGNHLVPYTRFIIEILMVISGLYNSLLISLIESRITEGVIHLDLEFSNIGHEQVEEVFIYVGNYKCHHRIILRSNGDI